MYPQPTMLPIGLERAMQRIIGVLNSSQSDKDKLRRIELFTDAWLYGKPEPRD